MPSATRRQSTSTQRAARLNLRATLRQDRAIRQAAALAGKSVTEQTQEVLATIDELLADAGTDKTKLLSAQIFLASISTFAEMNAVWDKWVAPGHTPARATIEARLAAPQYTVEIMVVAAR